MKVSNFKHQNQFLIECSDFLMFQSYDSAIAKIDKDNELTLYENWDYSATTSRHLNEFLLENDWKGKDYYETLKFIKKYNTKKAIQIMIGKGIIIKGY